MPRTQSSDAPPDVPSNDTGSRIHGRTGTWAPDVLGWLSGGKLSRRSMLCLYASSSSYPLCCMLYIKTLHEFICWEILSFGS